MVDKEKYYTGLIKDIKIVAYARFNKIRRLKRNNFLGLLSISVVSILVIILSIVEKIYNIKTMSLIPLFEPNIEIWFFCILASIIILCISIALSTMKIDIEIERLNKSAVELNEVRRKIEFNIENSNYQNSTLFDKYLEIIKSDLINHDEVDYKINKYLVSKVGSKFAYYRMYFIDQNFTSIFYLFITFLSFSSIISIILQVMLK
ncbi:SLATT domain-containing protein [Acinetobacter baumannii]|uniref:SLATT domain-containing protein n=5 Tax=Acinetobacter baumannii TaxID=470 RepID=UPI0002BBFE16|nr:SLATT domain-containing protein [Acinetobacter baumannii]EHT1073908.1 SLATT domain-containing protein [Acinetobacter baumannii]EJB8488276.1 SLATT domain-containing protein [Acinetobacter baumannii]EKU6046195.1 SLATT domain-containing protein [Acinetobacter baumannii]EKU6053710.1 SLATT domain-containing protein [Acinetobacter baumannii]EKV4287172.1 SLATT domain-containing protein [Acinetobacter baumannii]